MANTNQGLRQESVRAVTGTTLAYNGDWIALFRLSSIDTGSFDGDMLAWINVQLGTTYTNLSGAMVAYAQNQGFDNWGSMGTFTPSAAAQFLNRITNPGATRNTAYTAIINALVSGNVWGKLDTLWILAADIQANALINLKSSSYSLTNVGSAFVADQGFTGGTLTMSFNASTAGGQYARDSAHMSCWIRNDAGEPALGVNVASSEHIYPHFSGDLILARINTSSGASAPALTAIGHTIGNRSGANDIQIYKNGAVVGSSAGSASFALANENFQLLRGAGTPFTGQMAVASFGSSLNSTEATAFYNALNNNKWW